jgi:hypothetical protein
MVMARIFSNDIHKGTKLRNPREIGDSLGPPSMIVRIRMMKAVYLETDANSGHVGIFVGGNPRRHQSKG